MPASRFLRVLSVVSVLALAGTAQAADLVGHSSPSACFSYTQSVLPQQTVPEIKQTLWNNFESSKAGMDDPRVQSARQPALAWAMQARWACSAAIGYLDGGVVDAESVQKCDCFHQRFMSLR
jgi:hypothetical protein